MNYPYPIPNSQSDLTAFVANSTGVLGTYVKSIDARTQINVDYSQVIPAVTLQSYSFKVKPGGEPQLHVGSVALTATSLSFYLDGGIGGRAYEVTINVKVADTEVRTDVLNVQMLEDGCACPPPSPPPPPSGAVSADGGVYVNTAPRLFVSATAPVGANVMDQWYDTTSGNIYEYISDGISGVWQLLTVGTGVLPPTNVATIVKLAPIAPDGTATTFTLRTVVGQVTSIGSASDLFVSVDGVWQEPFTQYLANASQITFTEAPGMDSRVFMVWFMPPAASMFDPGGDGANIVKMNPITPDGTTTIFVLTASDGSTVGIAGANYLFVSVDGVWQEPGVQYTATGNQIAFAQPPTADAAVFMVWFAS